MAIKFTTCDKLKVGGLFKRHCKSTKKKNCQEKAKEKLENDMNIFGMII